MVLHTLAPILLTGATGLIGGELLRVMVQRGMRNVTALVRPRGDVGPQAQNTGLGDPVHTRVIDRLQRSGMDAEQAAGITATPADLRQPGLGLDPREADRIAARVELIIHAASETSFIRARDCWASNVDGMRHLLEFARTCRRNPLIVYFSTAANSGCVMHRCLREEEGCRADAPHHNAYTHSKAVAEQMLWDSGLPALVLRPSIVLSAGLPDPLLARAILWFVPLLNALDGVPIAPSSRLDTVPVGFVVESTLALLQKEHRRWSCYHLAAGPACAVTCGEIVAFLNRFYDRRIALEMIPPERWTRELHRRFVRTAQQRKIFSLLRHYLPFLNMDVVYDTARLSSDLGEAAGDVPRFTEYLGELLELIPLDAALAEAVNP